MALGIDFGTSFTTAACVIGDTVAPVSVGYHSTGLMSAAFLPTSGALLYGQDALRLARTDPDPHWSGRAAFTHVISPMLAYVTTLYTAYGVWRQDAGVLDWFVAIVLLLTINAATSCWGLMEEIGRQVQKTA